MPKNTLLNLALIALLAIAPQASYPYDFRSENAYSAGQFFYMDSAKVITRGGEAIPLSVEIAISFNQMEQGLMHRWHLPEYSGMLFLFHDNIAVDFWMKNTPLPLDIMFIDQSGNIINIAHNATPESTKLIHSGGEVLGVLELAGGSAKRLHIAKGDRVVYPWFHE